MKTVKRCYSGYEKREHVQGYVFLTPAIIILSVFIGLSVLFIISKDPFIVLQPHKFIGSGK